MILEKSTARQWRPAGMLFRGLLLGMVMLISASATGQVARPPTAAYVDSLQKALARAPADTSRLRLLEVLAAVLHRDQGAAAKLAAEGQRLAHRLGDRRYETEFLLSLGITALIRGDYAPAAQYYQQAVRLGEAAWRQHAPNDDIRRPFSALLCRAENGLGDLAGNQEDFRGACRHYRAARYWANITPQGYRHRLALQAMTYSNLLQAYTFRLDTPHPADSLMAAARAAALATQQVARAMRQEGNEAAYLGYIANAWAGESGLYARENRLDSAIALNRRALGHYQQLGAGQQILQVQQQLVAQEAAAGHHAAAVALARQTQAMAHRMGPGLASVEADCFATLVTSLQEMGDWRGAAQAGQKALALRDSLHSAEKRSALAELQVRFDTERKEARIRALSQRAQLALARADRQRQQVWALVAVLLLVVSGTMLGAVLYVRLRRSQLRLTHLTALKDQLFAIIGHDLRAPVAGFRQLAPVLYGFSQQLEPGEQLALAQSFDESSAQLAGLLDNLLDWGRVQTHALALRPEPTELGALLSAEVRAVAAVAEAKQLQVQLDVPASLPRVSTDPTLLRVIVRNLLANALKFTPPGGTITLMVYPTAGGAAAEGVPAKAENTTLLSAPGAGVFVGVRDTGVGMSSARLRLILRAEAGDSMRGTAGEVGTGLGLRVAEAFARELGGRLQGESLPGAGTTMGLTLPA